MLGDPAKKLHDPTSSPAFDPCSTPTLSVSSTSTDSSPRSSTELPPLRINRPTFEEVPWYVRRTVLALLEDWLALPSHLSAGTFDAVLRIHYRHASHAERAAMLAIVEPRIVEAKAKAVKDNLLYELGRYVSPMPASRLPTGPAPWRSVKVPTRAAKLGPRASPLPRRMPAGLAATKLVPVR